MPYWFGFGISRNPGNASRNTITAAAGIIGLTIAIATSGQPSLQVQNSEGENLFNVTGSVICTGSGSENTACGETGQVLKKVGNGSGNTLLMTWQDVGTVANSGALTYGYDGSTGLFTQEDAQFLIAIVDGTFTEVQARCDEAPTGAAVQMDVKECDADCSTSCTSIFSTNPEIDAAATVDDNNHAFSDTSMTAGSCYVFDIDQVGSGGTGTGLTLQIGYNYPKNVE